MPVLLVPCLLVCNIEAIISSLLRFFLLRKTDFISFHSVIECISFPLCVTALHPHFQSRIWSLDFLTLTCPNTLHSFCPPPISLHRHCRKRKPIHCRSLREVVPSLLFSLYRSNLLGHGIACSLS